MKLCILFLFLAIPAAQGHPPTRPDIDTVSILGISPGLDGKLVASHLSGKIDTLLWNDEAGVGIIKSPGSYLGSKGEFRVAYDKGLVSQVSFVAPTHTNEETTKVYAELSAELVNFYGPADVQTTDAIHEMRWEGLKQSISVKAIDDTKYVTIALSKF